MDTTTWKIVIDQTCHEVYGEPVEVSLVQGAREHTIKLCSSMAHAVHWVQGFARDRGLIDICVAHISPDKRTVVAHLDTEECEHCEEPLVIEYRRV